MQKSFTLALILGISLTACMSRPPQVGEMPMPNKSEENVGLTDECIRIAEENSDVRTFIQKNPDYSVEITGLTPRDASVLSERYPAIYGELPDRAFCEARFASGRGGLLVIIDYEKEAVLDVFRLKDMSIGG